tara:strand:- start:6602 stop:9037 length:2436 start_codon:yes stop_codon:yes gene_type:complete
MSNPLKTHTDNLQDGGFIFSSSLTNMLEAAHGNGVFMLEDYATGSGIRNTPASLSGAVSKVDASTIRIKGGFAVIDGLLVDFAGGYSSNAPADTFNVDLDNSSYGSALTSGQSVIFVVYVTTDNSTGVKRIGIERSSATSSFPVTPSSFLNEGGALDVDQTVVLALVKADYASNSTTMDIDIQTIYDVRTFIRPSPIYLGRMSTGAVGATVSDSNRINEHQDLDGMQGGGTENGAFTASDLGALWMSSDPAGEDVLFFSGTQGGSRRTHRLGPNKALVSSPSSDLTFEYDGYNFFILTPSSAITLTPDTSDSPFPPGHVVYVSNLHSSNAITFENGSNDITINGNSGAVIVYNGTAWYTAFSSTSASTAASGASGLIQLSDGSSGFTSDTDLSFTTGTNTLNVGGPIIMSGSLLKAPTGLEFTPTSSNPGTAANTLWKDSGSGTYLRLNADAVLTTGNFATLFATSTVGIHSLTAASIASGDFLAIADATDSNTTRKESIDDIATLLAGTGLTASSAVIGVDAAQPTITSIGPSDAAVTIGQNLIVTGDLTVSGSTTTISSTTITVDDKHVELNAVGSPSDANADGGGLILKSASDRSILWSNANDAWTFNQNIYPSADSSFNIGADATRFTAGYFDTVYGAGNFSTITGSGDVAINTNDFVVDTDGSNPAKVGINQATPLAPLQIANLGFGEVTGTLSSTDNNGSNVITMALFAVSQFRSAKLLIEVDGDDGTGGGSPGNRVIEAAEAVVTHDGSDGRITTYGVVQSNASETLQATYSVTVSSGNLNLVITPEINSVQYDARVTWQGMVA